MAKWATVISTAFFIGLLLGVLIMWKQPGTYPAHELASMPVANVASEQSSSAARVNQLEAELRQLRRQLEKTQAKLAQANADEQEQPDDNDAQDKQQTSDPLTEQNLIAAGVNASLAADIMYRISELEYKKLALRDRAIRGDYYRSQRYFHELRVLNEQQLSLRKEIGDTTYDHYLYQTGQNNRVAVNSVMADSPAQQNGIRNGDILLRYNGKPVYSWNEIRRQTSQGNLSDYVSVDIQRNGDIISLTLPRGPLGVKLNPLRNEPNASP